MANGASFNDMDDYSSMVSVVIADLCAHNVAEMFQAIRSVDKTLESWLDSVLLQADYITALATVAVQDPSLFAWSLAKTGACCDSEGGWARLTDA